MKQLRMFWKALESVSGLTVVSRQWQDLCREEYDLVQGFFRPTGKLCGYYPNPGPYALPYRVVTHAPDDHAGVCDETGQVIPLTTADISLYQLDRPALHRAIATAMELDYENAPLDGSTYRLGTYCPMAGYRFPAFLTIRVDPRDVQHAVDRLAVTEDAPFLLLAPTYGSAGDRGTGRLPSLSRCCSSRRGRD